MRTIDISIRSWCSLVADLMLEQNQKSHSFCMAIMIKRNHERWLILIDRYCNVVESMLSSCLCPGIRSFVEDDSLVSSASHFSRSLGFLNCIRVWHDNSGQGPSASWFLKYIIVRDLQTMDKFHFIGQRWFAVEQDDGHVRCSISCHVVLFYLLVKSLD